MASQRMARGWNTASPPAWGAKAGSWPASRNAAASRGDEEGADRVPFAHDASWVGTEGISQAEMGQVYAFRAQVSIAVSGLKMRQWLNLRC
jgi:hypothetical protein